MPFQDAVRRPGRERTRGERRAATRAAITGAEPGIATIQPGRHRRIHSMADLLPEIKDLCIIMEDAVARLEPVREQALACPRCDLALTRRHVVFGEGNPNSPLVLIGEGPGETEDATGRPFVGRAGQLLDKALAENGMTRQHVYICNVIKCRACSIEDGRASNRPPTPQEIDACKPWLVQQLEIIRPLVIVCVGSPAANTIIHKNFQITRERGQWFECPHAPYATAVLHPAFILRQHGEPFDAARATLVQDIGAARLKVIEAKKQPPAQPQRSLFDGV